ncbi:MAG: PhoU domain-containing protein [Nitrososphaeria archaeon]
MSQEQVVDMIVQLKDLSEMMVDLAHFALIYGNEEIADQVIDMEEIVDKLYTKLELAVLESRGTQPAAVLLSSIRLAVAAEQIADAAYKLASIVKRGAKAHHILKLAMEKADETIVATTISDNSVLVNKSLGELGLEDDIGMKIIAVKRHETWTYNPKDFFKLASNDLIIARGYSEGRERLLNAANPKT